MKLVQLPSGAKVGSDWLQRFADGGDTMEDWECLMTFSNKDFQYIYSEFIHSVPMNRERGWNQCRD
jgi:hypothetical protein